MFVFKDTTFKYKSNARFELSKVYGVGYERASKIADLIGLGQSTFLYLINYYVFEVFSVFFRIYYITDDRLKFLIKQQMSKLLEIKSIKGIRFSKGLPIRGQRTHSNSKQTKYYKKGEI
jgi:small subunit ribosomal protein S13